MEEWIIQLHVWLTSGAQTLAKPIYDFALHVELFGVTAFLLGVVGATAPCQFTSNMSAIAMVTKTQNKRSAWLNTGTFILGKSIVYIVLGLAAMGIGITIEDIPFVGETVFRQLLGPVLMGMGLIVMGLIPFRMRFLSNIYMKVSKWFPFKNSSFGLGVTMGFLFCPTLFWLCFGLLIPTSNTRV